MFGKRFFKDTAKPSAAFLFYKRLFDIITALILLPILAVICGIALTMNPFLNRGRLFYVQDRVGKNNDVFQIYKLRTMQTECVGDNKKITRLGRFMRDIHIDELPQIINVLLGDMSLIGPRPEQLESFHDYAESIQNFSERLSVRPGISGLAQLRYGHTNCHVGAQRKLKWDLEYIRHQGFGMDSKIYLRTYAYVFPRIGKCLIGLVKPSISD
jgi:lipopolysaccharide/colanic/teichoic acid biosynthesis glycosyltransferase